jgi:hypothetical protein
MFPIITLNLIVAFQSIKMKIKKRLHLQFMPSLNIDAPVIIIARNLASILTEMKNSK